MASQATYYFNASASSVTDVNTVWTDDANAFDGNTGTAASRAGIVGGGFGANYLGAFGTDAPSAHASNILTVELRLYGGVTSGNQPQAGIDIGGTQQGADATSGSSDWGSYVLIEAPSGGWTWSIISGLGVRMWANPGGSIACFLYRAEIRVTYSSSLYDRMIPMNNQDAMPTATTSQSLGLPHANTDTWNATDANRITGVFPNPAILHSLYGKLSASQDQNKTINVDRNESTNTGLSFTINSGGTTGSNTTHQASFLAGDRAQLEEANASASSTTPFLVSSAVMLRSENWPMFGTSFGNLSTTLNRYVGIQGNSAETTLAAAAVPWPDAAGNLTGTVYGAMSASLGSGSYVCTLLKNGSSTGIVVTFDSSNQFPTTSFSDVAVAQYDEFVWECVPTGTPSNARGVSFGISFAPTTAGTGVLLIGDATNLTTGTTNYNSFMLTNNAWDATESNVQAYGLAGMTINNMTVKLSAAPGAGKNRAFAFRQNGASAGPAVTISDANTTGSNSTNLALSNLDLINVMQTPTGTPTNANGKVGISFTGAAVANPSVGGAVKDMIGGMLGIPTPR